MRHNPDVMRKILVDIEAHPTDNDLIALQIPGYSEDEISDHVRLLAEAGLVEPVRVRQCDGCCWYPRCLTSQGREFLNAARDDLRWEQTKKIMANAGGFVLEIAGVVLNELAKRQSIN